MNWGSWAAFWEMGGRGFYVWGAYLISAVCIVGELLALRLRKRTLARQLTQMHRLPQSASK